MGAAGPRAASLAARIADGIVTSVRDVDDSLRSVIEPYRSKSTGAPSVMVTRWTVLGDDVEEQWRALGPLRGLRVAPRAVSVDPADLRRRADAAGPEAVLAAYTIARDETDLVRAYRPLVERLGPDYVSIQVATTDARRTIEMLGAEVLPELRGPR
jgi:alkanesulfonate monooxygenase SsuD/methylene tetrahydromethanopterin reductase-like flavin-dependent oxidoreductase (luciferase family)